MFITNGIIYISYTIYLRYYTNIGMDDHKPLIPLIPDIRCFVASWFIAASTPPLGPSGTCRWSGAGRAKSEMFLDNLDLNHTEMDGTLGLNQTYVHLLCIYIYIIVFFLGYVWSREMSFPAVADVVSVASSSWTSNERRVSWSILLGAHCPELNAQIAKFQYYYDLLWTSMNNKKQQTREQTKQQKLMHGWRNRSTCLFRKGSRPKNGEPFHCKRKFMDPSPYFWALAMSNIVVGYIRIRSGHILPTLSRDSHFGRVYPCDLFSNSFEPKKLPRLSKYP